MAEIELDLKARSKILTLKISEYDLAMLDRNLQRLLPGYSRSEVIRGLLRGLALAMNRIDDGEMITRITLIIETDNGEEYKARLKLASLEAPPDNGEASSMEERRHDG